MLKIIGVRFKSVGKIYYFDPKDYDVKMGDKVKRHYKACHP